MQTVLKLVRAAALPLAVIVAIGFGVTEALRGTSPPCNAPGPCDDDADCEEICVREGFPGPGSCIVSQDCCLCAT